MLQIASGKLFDQAPEQRNILRGVLYSNLRPLVDKPVETAAGRILPTNALSSQPNQLVYEFEELIEDAPSSGVIASHGIEPYLHDFAAIVALALNVTCAVTPETVSRLLGDERSTTVWYPPNSFIPRVFDQQVWCREDELSAFIKFVSDLMALERRSFLGAMRAIRTYVMGLHRLADDLEMAYTLFVASIESLAQQFDDFQPTWNDYDESKRRRIDIALTTADNNTVREVRKTLLQVEKIALARRFREFAVAHVRHSYFGKEAIGVQQPASRADLVEALKGAYRLRSRYIHELQELPRALMISTIPGDTIRVDGATLFTFRGIARMARHVIIEFVNRQPKLRKETYDYRPERYGIAQLSLAPQYWVANTENLNLPSGTKRLEGFLTQLSLYFGKEDKAEITDLQPMLEKAERMLASLSQEQRRPFLALYVLFNALLPEDRKMASLARIEDIYRAEIAAPCIEGVLVHLVLRSSPNWPLKESQRIYDDYFDQRGTKNGLRVPRTFEAGMSLELAEQYRLVGNIDKARELVVQATECHPGHKPLHDIEKSFVPERTLDWFRVIFPAMTMPDKEDPDPVPQ